MKVPNFRAEKCLLQTVWIQQGGELNNKRIKLEPTLAKRWAQSSAVIANKVFIKVNILQIYICYAALLFESLSKENHENFDKCHSCIFLRS